MTVQPVQKSEESYDEVPYVSMSYPQTHPPHLHTVATLFDLTPPDFHTAKVLELGCAGGGNLISQAMLYPQAHFTGLDMSVEQIAEATGHVKALGLKNITFRQEDILALDLTQEKEKYDYIIAHGVLSWVPEPVRAALFAFCEAALTPHGLAVISYNTLPGWNAVRSVREMMLYHAARFKGAEEKIRQSRALLEFLIASVPGNNTSYRAVLEAERHLLNNTPDSYIYHDHLENENTQFYLHDFVRMANASNLDYVGDTVLSSMFVGNMPENAVESLAVVGDIVAQEQYMDFINNRRFRTSILCRSGQKIDRELRAGKVLDYHLAANYAIAPEKTNGLTSFKAQSGMTFTANDAAAAALFSALAEQGTRPIEAGQLVKQVAAATKIPEKDVQAALLTNGLQLVLRGLVWLYADSPKSATEVSEKPETFALARYQASQPDCLYVTNMAGASLKADNLGCILLSHMDGTRNAPALIDVLIKAINEGKLKAEKEGKPVSDGALVREDLEKTIETLLPGFAAQHLLVA